MLAYERLERLEAGGGETLREEERLRACATCSVNAER